MKFTFQQAKLVRQKIADGQEVSTEDREALQRFDAAMKRTVSRLAQEISR